MDDCKHESIHIPQFRSRSSNVVISSGTRDAPDGQGNPELNQTFTIITDGGDAPDITCDASAACSVFCTIAKMEDPRTGAILTEKDLLMIARRAIAMLSDIIHDRVDIIQQGKAQYEERVSYQGKYVNMGELDDALLDPMARLMLQIVLTFKMAQTICDYNDDDDYFYSQFVAIRNLFTRVFYQPPDFPSMIFDRLTFEGYAPVPFDAFIQHGHPATHGVSQFLENKYQISITLPNNFVVVDARHESASDDGYRFYKVCDGWDVVSSPSNAPSGYNDRITNRGFQVAVYWHLVFVTVLFFGSIACVAAVNVLRREWLDDAGIDPTSLLSLIIVILGILTTGIKAALVQDWSWYDCIRGCYYVTRVGHTHINLLAGCAVNAPKEQQAHFNKTGFSYVIGSEPDGSIVADVPVSSAQLIKHGVVVLEQTRQKTIKSTGTWAPTCIVLPTANGGIYELENVGGNVYVVKDRAQDLGIILTQHMEILLR
ncbi:hypothetical protein BC940DRAFT_291626 [Gongronella butleri]|nr:hypothetical protein BC940DRAFT_291626 [Gongronella butleri]